MIMWGLPEQSYRLGRNPYPRRWCHTNNQLSLAITLRSCTKHTSPSGTGTSDEPCFENSTLSPFATLICKTRQQQPVIRVHAPCLPISCEQETPRPAAQATTAVQASRVVKRSELLDAIFQTHLYILANSHHCANERLVNRLAAAGRHDQATCCLLSMFQNTVTMAQFDRTAPMHNMYGKVTNVAAHSNNAPQTPPQAAPATCHQAAPSAGMHSNND
jgi:hypothetical protein